ncbi:MAG: hypothetical protein VYB17_00210 [Candidatus Thermoplasmatota archaeon]|nr:hypothetical protein [Candidatus Thermoplasmatota archaeon]
MRKSLTLFLFAILLLPAPVQAGAPVMIPNQGILGGYMIDLTNVSGSFGEFNAGGDMAGVQVVEVYTATWCQNCVYSEHALMDALENESATVLVTHRFIGESQDPFGTQAGDDRWIDLYGETSAQVASGLERAAPSVVFDGYRFVAGSAPSGESLESDYSEMFADKHEYRFWDDGIKSEFTWTGNNSSGILEWDFDIYPVEPEWMSWRHHMMVVEHSAYFPEGGNGLEHYDDIVRAVIELNVTGNNGTALGGQQEITLPTAYDGDDLALVVVHEWKQTPPAIEPNPNEDPASLPGFIAPLGLIALGAAALTRRE